MPSPTRVSPRRRRIFRALLRIAALLFWTLISAPIQFVCLLLPTSAKRLHPLFYWRITCAVLGMRIRVIGAPAIGHPVIYVSNHSSWLDIPALGSVLQACFVAKAEIEHWPLIGLIAKLGRTIFVSRARAGTGRETSAISTRLDRGDNLILFPEGSSSDGSRVLPFRSSFFAVAEAAAPPLFQPISIVYDRLDGLSANHATRPILAWYGDMDLAPHLWDLAQRGSLRCSILIHPPLDPALFSGRKDLARTAQQIIAEGAALLRQNHPIGRKNVFFFEKKNQNTFNNKILYQDPRPAD